MTEIRNYYFINIHTLNCDFKTLRVLVLLFVHAREGCWLTYSAQIVEKIVQFMTEITYEFYLITSTNLFLPDILSTKIIE